MRTCWDSVGFGAPAHYTGEHYRLRLDEHLHRKVRPRIPIYLSAMGPRMIELAGEVADGLLGGWRKEQAAVREALQAEGPAALERVTDDKLVQAFSIVGRPDECRGQLQDYADLVTLPLLHVPYFAPLTSEESEDAFRNILETFGN